MLTGKELLEKWSKVEDPTSEKKIPIMELFGPTIEGEGAVIGVQTFFIRVAGCDYKCKKCDSLHAVLPEMFSGHAIALTPKQLAWAFNEYAAQWPGIQNVVLTGGNPCLYDFNPFIDVINGEMGSLEEGRRYGILVETQGTFCPDWLSKASHVTVSPKGPGFGEKFEQVKFMDFIGKVENHTGATMNVKIVLFDVRDLDFSEYVVGILESMSSEVEVYLSIGNHNTPTIVESFTKDHPGGIEVDIVGDTLDSFRIMLEEIQAPHRFKLQQCRILPQLHVLLWGNKAEV